MVKAYSYIRMSTPEQIKGDSQRRQMEASDRYILEHGLEAVSLILDLGVSAYRGDNSTFGKLSVFLEQVKKGKIERGSYLIVESLDRITRQSLFKAVALLTEILNAGIVIVTLFDKRTYSYENSNDILIAVISLMRGNEESKVKSDRQRASWQRKRDTARLGRVTTHVLPHWLRYSEDRLSIEAIDSRAIIIKTIFQRCIDGWGAYSIAKQLNEQGVETWGRAAFWQESYVKKILHNRAVIGEYAPHTTSYLNNKLVRIRDGDPLENYYPTIIEKGKFLHAQSSLSQRAYTGRGRKGKLVSNLFSTLLRCKYCESPIRFIDKGSPPKGGQYLRCTNALLTNNCKTWYFKYADFEFAALSAIEQLGFNYLDSNIEDNSLSKILESKKLEIQDRISYITDQIDNLISINVALNSKAIIEKLPILESEKILNEEMLLAIERDISDCATPDINNINLILERLYKSDVGPDEMREFRLRLSTEIKKIISGISVGQDRVQPWEQDDDSKSISTTEFSFTINYRNGLSQVVDNSMGRFFYMGTSDRHKMMVERWKVQSAD